MYSFGTTSPASHEPYGSYAAQPGGPREGARGERRAEAQSLRGASDSLAYGDGRTPGAYSVAPPASPMDGLLQAFGDFLRTAFDKLSQMLTGVLGGAMSAPIGGTMGASSGLQISAPMDAPMGGPPSTGSISGAVRSGALQPGQSLDLGCGESVSRGQDGSLELIVNPQGQSASASPDSYTVGLAGGGHGGHTGRGNQAAGLASTSGPAPVSDPLLDL